MRIFCSHSILICLLAIALTSTSGYSVANPSEDWAKVNLPKYVRLFNVGQQIEVNGLSMSIKGFIAAQAPHALLEDIRETMKQPLVESKIGSQWVLGRADGAHYITVQVEPAGSGSRGIVAITDLKLANESKLNSQLDRELWQSRLPTGSVLLSNIRSTDADKLSHHLVFSNTQSSAFNIERIKTFLREEGLTLEREVVTPSKINARSSDAITGRVLYFSGTRKEAIATVHQDAKGETVSVLNIITPSYKPK